MRLLRANYKENNNKNEASTYQLHSHLFSTLYINSCRTRTNQTETPKSKATKRKPKIPEKSTKLPRCKPWKNITVNKREK